MFLTKKRFIFWHLLLPFSCLLNLIFGGPQPWIFLALRFIILILLLSKERGAPLIGKLLIAYAIESLALTLLGWLFGRSIM